MPPIYHTRASFKTVSESDLRHEGIKLERLGEQAVRAGSSSFLFRCRVVGEYQNRDTPGSFLSLQALCDAPRWRARYRRRGWPARRWRIRLANPAGTRQFHRTGPHDRKVVPRSHTNPALALAL